MIDYIFTALFHVSIITSVYINLYLLIPKFLDKQHYLIYIISLAALFLLFYALHVFTFDILSEVLFPNYYLITFYSYLELLKYFVIYIGLTTLFMLSKYWFELLESKKKLAEAEKEKIQNELEFIYNYIDLQKLRIQNPDLVEYTIDGKVTIQKIAPLILVVFIENAFKHGIKGDIQLQFIRINIIVKENEIDFKIENNKGVSDDVEQDKYKGLGLENVKRRLELMYPGKHYLAISNNNDKFMVRLVLQL